MPPKLGIVMPCYNEEAILPMTLEKITALLKDMIARNVVAQGSFAACVDDGSKDTTWSMVEAEVGSNPYIRGLKLAGNVGHQRALLSGLISFKEDAEILVSIDADLQDDIRVIEDMVNAYVKGADIVYGVRRKRDTDTFFKKQTAHFFYALMYKLGVKTVYNHADFRLSSRRALDGLEQFNESNLFLRGIYPTMGFKSSEVYYDRLERLAGESKYPLKKMLAFAWDGITSFSVQPLRLVTMIGFFVFFVSILLSLYVMISYFNGTVVAGWVSTVLPMYFLGGIQLLSIGIIGEYIGKIYKEVKHRPRYIVEKKIGKEE